METYQPLDYAPTSRPALPLKASIRDIIRVQQQYNLPDELFWEVFNTRVLLNEEIDMNGFIRAHRRPVV